jgi:hypothetical protein
MVKIIIVKNDYLTRPTIALFKTMSLRGNKPPLNLPQKGRLLNCSISPPFRGGLGGAGCFAMAWFPSPLSGEAEERIIQRSVDGVSNQR